MTSLDQSELCTVPQAAATLGVHPSTIWRWIDAGRLPAYRVGPKSIRIKRSDVERLICPVKPAEPEATSPPRETIPPPGYVPRRLTDEERERQLALLDEMAAHVEAQRARRGNLPLTESWEDINKARDERSQHLLDL